MLKEFRPLVLYHANCADGFCAAWVAHKATPNAEFIPVQYGQEPPNVSDRHVFILDFSYKRQTLLDMDAKTWSLTVIDHHKTAEKELHGLDQTNGLFVKFDTTKSGGRLAWEYFFPGKEAPWLVQYTEDRDLWKWELPDSREISACLASWPWTFQEWDNLDCDTTSLAYFAEQGGAILRYQSQQVENQCKNAVEIELDGHKILCVNATMLISEIAGKLAEGRPFGATYFIRSDGKKIWSLRSGENGVDVSEIAKAHGGGGHYHAAGFTE